jgi:hypothetical protein
MTSLIALFNPLMDADIKYSHQLTFQSTTGGQVINPELASDHVMIPAL